MNKYLLVKDNHERRFTNIDYNKLDGFKFNPKNNVENNGIMVNEMVLINPSFIESVLKRKTKKNPQSIVMPLASMQEKSLRAYENKFSKPLSFLCTIASDSNMLWEINL